VSWHSLNLTTTTLVQPVSWHSLNLTTTTTTLVQPVSWHSLSLTTTTTTTLVQPESWHLLNVSKLVLVKAYEHTKFQLFSSITFSDIEGFKNKKWGLLIFPGAH